MAAPSEAGVFAFDVPAHQTSAHQALEDSSQNSQDHVANRYQAKDFVNSNSVSTQDMEKAEMALDPELHSHHAAMQTDRPASHRTNKPPLTVQPPSYPIMANTTSGSNDTGNDTTHQTRGTDQAPSKLQRYYSSGFAWQQAPGVSQAPHGLHSAPITADNMLQTYQTSIQPIQQPTVPPATAPLTIGNASHGFQQYAPQYSTYNGQTTGPLQLQQSSYASAPPTQAASPASGQGQWYQYAPPTTAPSSMRPSLPYMHSVPTMPTATSYSPLATQDSTGSGSGYPRLQSFAELQQEVNSVPMMSQQWASAAPMMVRESVRPMGYPGAYDPSVAQANLGSFEAGRLSRAGSWSHDRSREQSTRGREESSDEEGVTPNTSKEMVNYAQGSVDGRSRRGRQSVAGGSSKSFADHDRDWEESRQEKSARGRPKKKAKHQERPVAQNEEVVAVKANGKGNQFILTLYAMVDAPSSYPLIGWNLPGTAIIVPDSKAFAAEMLNKYFRHSTISSFARQLVSYGFLKTELPARERAMVTHGGRSDSKHWTFSHDFFLRGRADLLDQVAPLLSPGNPQRNPPAKKSLAALKREEEAFVEVLKRENTHWRERCQRLEQCMLEEKARANQYFTILVERGIVSRPTKLTESFQPPMAPLQVQIPSAVEQQHAQRSPALVEVSIKSQDKLEGGSRRPPSAEEQGQLKATLDSGRDHLGQVEEALEVPPSA